MSLATNSTLHMTHAFTRATDAIEVAEHLSLSRALFEWFLSRVEFAVDTQRHVDASRMASAAAQVASSLGSFGDLASLRLEASLARIAETLPPVTPKPRSEATEKQRWLHVLNGAWPIFGHTKLCRMWIESDIAVIHDVVLLQQRFEVPSNLLRVVVGGGGSLVTLDPTDALLGIASKLRQYAYTTADVVVLHTHPSDVIAPIAFGVAGGPPVLLVNHADHLFWPGVSIADCVVDIRDAGHRWTRDHRGARVSAIVPVPLGAADEKLRGACTSFRADRARAALGIADGATVLLTIGNAYKYVPSEGLDFLAAARSMLLARPNAILMAVGPRHEGPWRQLSDVTGGRVRAMGNQFDLSLYHEAADIYLEGFPVGSLTALLEAGLAGIPSVRAPGTSYSPLTADGVGLAGLERPDTVERYVSLVLRLIDDEQRRTETGTKLRDEITRHHCGPGWLSHLQAMKTQIPSRHAVHPGFSPSPVSADTLRSWVRFLRRVNGINDHHDLCENLLLMGMRSGLGLDDSTEEAVTALLAGSIGIDPNGLRKDFRRARRAFTQEVLQECCAPDRRGLAIREIVRFLGDDVRSIGDPAWRRLAIKAALGPELTGYVRHALHGVKASRFFRRSHHARSV
jgi:hypothetical protein